MKRLLRILFPFLLAVPISGLAQTMILLPPSIGRAIRAVPPDSAAAWCILSDTVVFRGDTAVYIVDAAHAAGRAIKPTCQGAGVLLVRPPCAILAPEIEWLANSAAWATTVLLCGDRDPNRKPMETYIWRQSRQPQRGKIA